jgi:cysteine desulfurase/selenocysteine lyase
MGPHNLKQEDEVLLTLMEHHSNIVPWEILSKIKGFKIKYVDINPDGTLNHESLKGMLSPKVKLVCITHVSNVTGVINDVKTIAKLAHENGALVLVDGAQSVPHMPVNVKDLDCDFPGVLWTQNAWTNWNRCALREKGNPRKNGTLPRRRRND